MRPGSTTYDDAAPWASWSQSSPLQRRGGAWLGDHAGRSPTQARRPTRRHSATPPTLPVATACWPGSRRPAAATTTPGQPFNRAPDLTDRAGTTSSPRTARSPPPSAPCVAAIHRRRRNPRGPDRRRWRGGRWANPSAGAGLVEAYVGLGRTADAVALTRAVRRRNPFVRTLMGEGARPPLPGGSPPPATATAQDAVRDGARGQHQGVSDPVREAPAPAFSSAPGSAATDSGSLPASSCASPTTPSPEWSSPTGRHRPPPSSPPPAPTLDPAWDGCTAPAAHLTGDPRRPPGRRGQVQP